MSWVDLAALTLALWVAVNGYLLGAFRALSHLCGIVLAFAAALVWQRPFATYLNREWQAEAVLAKTLPRYVENPLKTAFGDDIAQALPSLSWKVVKSIAPEAELTVASGMDTAVFAFGILLVRLLAVFLGFLLFSITVTLILRADRSEQKERELPEWQKLLGMFFGACQGVVLSLVVCLALDALSFTSWLKFIRADLDLSYLYMITERTVNLFLK